MGCWGIFRFEIGYQSRRVSTWLYFVVLLALTYYVTRETYLDSARSSGYFFNAPFVIAVITVPGNMMGLLIAAPLAGEAAARDVETRMDPLFYTTPIGEAAYLRCRFLAALGLYALVLLAVPIGLLLAALVPGPEAELIGPFRPSSYLSAYLSLALPTSLDLYRELQAATPDLLRPLLVDLFERNTFWELETERATAEQTAAGTWQVTLALQARRVVVDSAGVEAEMPLDDWVEVGVFAPVEEGEPSDRPLYLQKHRIRSGKQTMTVTAPRKPAHAGIDPHHLLIDPQVGDNTEEVKPGS
ncbi:MAG: hypothetical protein AB1505_01850 [Candidatus Latescibacterota bacterium]